MGLAARPTRPDPLGWLPTRCPRSLGMHDECACVDETSWHVLFFFFVLYTTYSRVEV